MIELFSVRVIPQAVCARYGLAIGARCAPFVLFLMYILGAGFTIIPKQRLFLLIAPIAWPIAKLLDWVLGHSEAHTYKKAELKSFLQVCR
jgi:metal transporter CNNM